MLKKWRLGLVTAAVLLLVAAGPPTEPNPEDSPGYCYVVIDPDGDGQDGPTDYDGECFETRAELYSAEGLPAPMDDPVQNAKMLERASAPSP